MGGSIAGVYASYNINKSANPGYSWGTNGNMINDGGNQTLEWDAANRLVAINYTGTTNRSEFTYDGLSRPVKIVEKTGNTVNSTKKFVWDGISIAEERNNSNSVTRRHFVQGVMISGAPMYYLRDHLGSIREMTSSTGAINARYDYDPYGNRTTIPGGQNADFGFTGFYLHSGSSLNFSHTREYDAVAARWLSRDPIGEGGGLNLYGYVGGNPISMVDPLGLYWYRQPWQTEYVVGRPRTPVPPGGWISRAIEDHVPAGRTFGEMHDSFVGAAAGAGIPDWLANIPSMIPMYEGAVVKELLRTLGILDQPTPPAQPAQCK